MGPLRILTPECIHSLSQLTLVMVFKIHKFDIYIHFVSILIKNQFDNIKQSKLRISENNIL